MIRQTVFRAVVMALAWPVVAAGQSFVVAPNIYENTEGPGSSNSLIRNAGNPRTVQIIFSATQLTEMVNRNITGVTYRLSNVLPGGYPLVTTTWSQYQIRLGPSVAPASAGTTFADNFLTATTLVRTGPLTVPPFAWQVGSPPNPSPWGIEITFNTPYLYTGGNLGLLVTHPGSDNPDQGNSLLDSSGSASPGVGTEYTSFVSNEFNGSSGVSTVFVNVLRFTTSAASVPEPGTIALLAASALGLGWVWWLRRRRAVDLVVDDVVVA
jgi:hypothetical protein